MIVDLVRNDLGKVARTGGVSVPHLEIVKSFRHLHHLESTVAAHLLPTATLSDLFLALFPGGSITGAPKRAALSFIHELEPIARGPYTGAAGIVRGDGTAVFNIPIRTAVLSGAGVDYHAGGGIVWDSDPEAEWEETQVKSREFVRATRALSDEGEVP
jgi:anthranilate/para-aminobenzoate synthase component I